MTGTKCSLFFVYNNLLSYSKHPSKLMKKKAGIRKSEKKLNQNWFQFYFLENNFCSIIFTLGIFLLCLNTCFTYFYMNIVQEQNQKSNFSLWFMIFYLPPFFRYLIASWFQSLLKFTTSYSEEEEETSCFDDLWQKSVKKVSVGCCCLECDDSGLRKGIWAAWKTFHSIARRGGRSRFHSLLFPKNILNLFTDEHVMH